MKNCKKCRYEFFEAISSTATRVSLLVVARCLSCGIKNYFDIRKANSRMLSQITGV